MYAETSQNPDPENDIVIKDFKDIVSTSDECLKTSFNNRINKDHSSAFIDINGDCINDLLIHSTNNNGEQNLEIWIGRKNAYGDVKYCLKEIKRIKKDFGLFSLSDVNNDGHLDIVFPIRNSQPPAIFIAYNQKFFDYEWTKNYCESVQSIKYDKNEKLFDEFDNNIITNVINIKYFILVLFKIYFIVKYQFTEVFNLTNEENLVFYESEKSPLLIRFGDLNLDSFADIITVMKNITDDTRFFRIIMNTPIKADQPIRIKNSYFDYSKTHKYIIYTDVEYVSFFDLDENGQLDVLMTRKKNQDYNITGFFNVEAYDNFFLKSLTTKSRNNFFSSEIGTNYRYYVTDLKGERKLKVGMQHAQISCLNLDLPYSFMGIGPSYNYVENYHVATSSSKNHTDSYLKVFTPIIPNSQLLIYNYNEETNVDNWELDLIVTPISKILLVVIVILAILAILLVVIIVLHFMEKVYFKSLFKIIFPILLFLSKYFIIAR